MSFDKLGSDIDKQEWIIPFWLKVLVAGFALGSGGIFIRALSTRQDTLFDLPIAAVLALSLFLFIISLLVCLAFLFYPKHAPSLFFYWVLRNLREQISVIALVGILYLIAIRAPFFSLRSGLSLGALLAMLVVGWMLKPVDWQSLPHPALDFIFQKFRKVSDGVERIPAWIAGGAVVVAPIVAVCLVIYIVFDSHIGAYGPYSFWNDEISYWVWLRSFIHSGFNSGYNAPNELVSAFEFSRYGEASPFYLYIYGLPARLTGWFTAFPVLINFLLLSSSILFFLRVVKLDNLQIILSGAAILLTWPVLLFLPITTHETLNQAIGIVLIAIIIIMLREREKINTGFRLAILGFVYLATLIRLSWGLMLIPVLFYCLNGSLWRRIVLAIGLGGGLYVSVIILMGSFLPPINNSILATFSAGFAGGFQALLQLVPRQFYAIFFDELNPNMAVVLQMLIIIGWSLGRIWQRIQSKSSMVVILQSDDFFQFYAMTSLILAGLLFYIVWGFYRTFAPVMLMVFLLQVVTKDYKRLVALLAINVLFVYPYMTYLAGIGDYRVVQADYSVTRPWDDGLTDDVNTWIVYDPQAQDPWCNTLLIPLGYYDSRLILIPPGIGISYILNRNTYKPPIRSRYVLFDTETYEKYRMKSNLELKAKLPIGDLYINKDVSCDPVD